MAISLGGIVLNGFEAPAGLRFGGDQALAVHRLAWGGRIIDTMGPDDSDIAWRGFLSGADAADRARQLDTMRQAGAMLVLAWDELCYYVVISRLKFVYFSQWWIQFDIACTTAGISAAAVNPLVQTSAVLVAADIATAGAWTNMDTAANCVAAPGAMTAGTLANAAAGLAIGAAAQQVAAGIAAADNAMAATDVGSLISAAGTLAGLAAARGFIGRAAMNLANAAS